MGRELGHVRVDLGRTGAVSLPVIRHGGAPRPRVTITGAVHGDELSGPLAIQQLDDRLLRQPPAGEVLLFPALNPPALAAASRSLPPDGGDLNRSFPGRRGGRPVERLAHAIWSRLQRDEPDVLIDLHADSSRAVPYVIVDRAVKGAARQRRALADRIEGLARASGLLVLHEYSAAEYRRHGLDRSLAGAMVNLAGRPALTVEIGGRGMADERAARQMVGAVERMLAHLGMISAVVDGPPVQPLPGPWRRGGSPRARADGLLFPEVDAGEPFKAGRRIASIKALDGSLADAVVAPVGGIVISWSDAGWVQTGWPVAMLAERGR